MQAVDTVNDRRWGMGVLKLASGKAGSVPLARGMMQDLM